VNDGVAGGGFLTGGDARVGIAKGVVVRGNFAGGVVSEGGIDLWVVVGRKAALRSGDSVTFMFLLGRTAFASGAPIVFTCMGRVMRACSTH
jgi:hypothetical protein